MREYDLTARGRAVVAICAGTGLMAWLFGARALGAVVLPGVVALAAAVLQLRRVDPPTVRRDLPPDDAVGTEHDVRLRFVDPDTGVAPDPFVADVVDATGPELSDPATTRAVVGEAPVTYRVSYEERGSPAIGPVRIGAIDVLGLLTRRMEVGGVERVLVYPERHPIAGWFRGGVYQEGARGSSRRRDEFDRLREYSPGDALRDVSWNATAKRDELIVKEFAAESEQLRVSIAGGARNNGVDALATATGSIALAMLDDGVPVDLVLPNASVEVTPGPEGRRRVLSMLARATAGEVPDLDADVVVDADFRNAVVRVDDAELAFEELRIDGTSDVESRPVEPIMAGEPA
jgi:uncharacterized protein (DUF58 family)